MKRRAEWRRRGRVARWGRAAIFGVTGFVLGAAVGWLVGGAAGWAFASKAPNPRIAKHRNLYRGIGVVVGAVVGAVVVPFSVGWFLSKSEAYDA